MSEATFFGKIKAINALLVNVRLGDKHFIAANVLA